MTLLSRWPLLYVCTLLCLIYDSYNLLKLDSHWGRITYLICAIPIESWIVWHDVLSIVCVGLRWLTARNGLFKVFVRLCRRIYGVFKSSRPTNFGHLTDDGAVSKFSKCTVFDSNGFWIISENVFCLSLYYYILSHTTWFILFSSNYFCRINNCSSMSMSTLTFENEWLKACVSVAICSGGFGTVSLRLGIRYGLFDSE